MVLIAAISALNVFSASPDRLLRKASLMRSLNNLLNTWLPVSPNVLPICFPSSEKSLAMAFFSSPFNLANSMALETIDEYNYQEELQLEEIADGVWAAMSERTHNVYIYEAKF